VYMRVVRFTDVDPDRLETVIGEINAEDGPPEGMPMHGLQMILDRDQRTAVVIQMFDSEDDMRTSEQVLDAMDASETPGTRSTIDRGEVRLELHA
jgi:hypothetical protein